ncbi:MAG TPA: DUF697 domain-containing protein [Burkholderiales bacterium]|nr:DUF697 domain-containing protein [Burkholderiales bacterium]
MSRTEVIRLPRSRAELEAAAAQCRRMVTRRALVSAGAVLVPLPGADIAADVALLTQLIPAINREFGLTPDQIEQLNPTLKVLVYKAIVAFGGAMVGRIITRDLILQALVKVGMRVTTKTAARLVPVAGQAVSAGLSFTAMRLVGESHIRDCRRVIEAIHTDRGDWAGSQEENPAPSAAQRLRAAAAKAASRLRRRPRA